MQYSYLRFGLILASLPAMLLSSVASAIDVPDYEFDWAVVGDPGNPAFDGPWAFGGGLSFFRPVGKVDRVFRVTRTEVTVGQWFEFVEAYAPYFTGQNGNNFAGTDFTSTWIFSDGFDEHGVQQFRMSTITERFPTTASFLFAAMYCNWLHNDKAPGEWAFRDGAYDIDVLELIAAGDTGYPDFHRRPGAKFWVSDIDEWTKAMYWDPDKNGPGRGGYWMYPHSSDEPPVAGVDTNAGTLWWDGPRPWEEFFNVGSFPHAASPWGLLDASGGEDEWLDYEWDPWMSRIDFTLRRGTIGFNSGIEHWDVIGRVTAGFFAWTDHGFRLSGVVSCKADFATRYGILDLADIRRFIAAYLSGEPEADLAEPFGVVGPEDIIHFIELFLSGCQ